MALEKYSLEETLGTGAYAKVKLAKCRETSEKVAVKIVDKKRSPKDYLAKFLCREMEIASILRHQNVIEVYEILETDNKVYFIMELAEGGDLLDYINTRGFLREAEARRILGQLLVGLQHCHERGVVHRDLKCENILLDKSSNVKITDFGFARKYKAGQHLETFCGSYAYASPQILNGEPYDGTSTDIWSVGIMLYAMVNGKLPFSDSNVRTLLRQIHGRLYFSKRVSQDCRQLIRKMLAIRTDERISITDILKDPFMYTTPSSTAGTSSSLQLGLLCATPHSAAAFSETLKEQQSLEPTQPLQEKKSSVRLEVNDFESEKSSSKGVPVPTLTLNEGDSLTALTERDYLSEATEAQRLAPEPVKLPSITVPQKKTISKPSSPRRTGESQPSYQKSPRSSPRPPCPSPTRVTTPTHPNTQLSTGITRPATSTPTSSLPPPCEEPRTHSASNAARPKKGSGLFGRFKKKSRFKKP